MQAAEIRAFVMETLREMNYDTEGIEDDSTLGPAGVDLESLALAELAVRVEDKYGVRFAEEESEELALMTVGEFTNTVADRAGNVAGAGQA
jgi:acyl carrier protein